MRLVSVAFGSFCADDFTGINVDVTYTIESVFHFIVFDFLFRFIGNVSVGTAAAALKAFTALRRSVL